MNQYDRKEKLEKLKKLADAMYYAAANLGPTVGSGEHLRKTMEEYHKFIIHEYHKEESEYLEEETTYCAFSTSHYTDKERKSLCKSCEEECRFNKKEEPSEDLEKEYDKYIENDGDEPLSKEYFLKLCQHFANWQKEQLLAKAVDGEVTYGKSLAIPSLGYRLDKERLDFGDKVKVIIIKKD